MAVFKRFGALGGSYLNRSWAFNPENNSWHDAGDPGYQLQWIGSGMLHDSITGQNIQTADPNNYTAGAYVDPFAQYAGMTEAEVRAARRDEAIQETIKYFLATPSELERIAASAPEYAQAWATQNPEYAGYWSTYGPWPATPQEQARWLIFANAGGRYTAQQQDMVASNKQTEMTEGLIFMATSALIGSMVGAWAAAVGAPAYGPGAMLKDIVNTNFPGLIPDMPWGANPDGGIDITDPDLWEPYELPGPTSSPLEITITNPQYEMDITNPDLWEPYELPGPTQPFINTALPDFPTVSDPAGSSIYSDPFMNPALPDIPTVNDPPGTSIYNDPIVPANDVIEVSTQPPRTITITDEYGNKTEMPYEIEPNDSGFTPIATGGASWVKTATGLVPLVTAGAGLIRTLTASDGTQREIPYAPGGTLNPDGTPVTLPGAGGSFPWWLLIAAAAAVTG